MTTFSFTVQSISLGGLALLFGYTLWLMRTGRLNAHVTVRWVIAEGAAFLAVLLWRALPLFSVTSKLGDRELLVILAVVFFVFTVFLILDCLVRISTHTRQIKLLTQELALLREESELCRAEKETPSPFLERGISASSIPKHFNLRAKFTDRIYFLVYVLWLLGILMLAWGTVPYMISPWVIVPPAPDWLSSFARLVFYRDYIF